MSLKERAPPARPRGVPRFRRMPHLSHGELDRLQGASGDEAPTWRGWALAILSCAAVSYCVPYADYLLNSTRLSWNLLPATSVVLVLSLGLAFNLGLRRARRRFLLTPQDLALIFSMSMLITALPTVGWLSHLVAAQLGPFHFARPENRWTELLHPYLPPELGPRDPANPLSNDPQPVSWFYAGLPAGEGIPWGLLVPPYLRWSLALVLLMGLFLAVAVLLFRQWSDHERLAFPLVQVPGEMLDLGGSAGHTGFLRDRVAWAGIALVFLFHSWNSLGGFLPNWPVLNLRDNSLDKYLTEPPFSYLRPFPVKIFPSVIGLVFLLPQEVSFSLWFFYLVVLKLCVVAAIAVFGLGDSGAYFAGTEGPQSVFTGQGTGAALVLVAGSLYLARKALKESLFQALGLAPRDPNDEPLLPPGATWFLLLSCGTGSAAWLHYYGRVDWLWSAGAVVLLVAGAVAVARIVCASGIFFIQMQSTPADLLNGIFTPAALGAQNLVSLNQWSRVFSFESFRNCPLIHLFTVLRLAALARLRRRSLLIALGLALLMALTIGFYSLNRCVYALGANRLTTWEFAGLPRLVGTDLSGKVARLRNYEVRKEQSLRDGRDVRPEEVPAEARTDRLRLFWIGVGAVVMGSFLLLRSRVFWWPHPIGYVMWMGYFPLTAMWFSFLLGWLIKGAITKYGGWRAFMGVKRFFVGLIVGEALAAVVWLAISYFTGQRLDYRMHFN